MPYYDDDNGQDDGDTAQAPPHASSNYVAASAGQPWLREGIPPWHLWGNSIPLVNDSGIDPSSSANTITTTQLIRASYKRPETWHWLFVATLLELPVGLPAATRVRIGVGFHLTIGIGRSQIQMPFFEVFEWQWQTPGGPTNMQLRSAQAPQWPRYNAGTGGIFAPDPREPGPNIITEIVAQDIQLSGTLTVGTTPNFQGIPVRVQLDAYFAPKTHVRPDWYLEKTPPEAVFAGAEIGGR